MKTLFTFVGFLLFTVGLYVFFTTVGKIIVFKVTWPSIKTLILGLVSVIIGLLVLNKSIAMNEHLPLEKRFENQPK